MHGRRWREPAATGRGKEGTASSAEKNQRLDSLAPMLIYDCHPQRGKTIAREGLPRATGERTTHPLDERAGLFP
eukprot:6437607-Pyramimonas_sp.AAC.1